MVLWVAPEDSELVVHYLLDRFTGADLTETLSRIEGTERESVSEGVCGDGSCSSGLTFTGEGQALGTSERP